VRRLFFQTFRHPKVISMRGIFNFIIGNPHESILC
jgi:hypothetical protein